VRASAILAFALLVAVLGASAATQFIAATFDNQPILGVPLLNIGDTALYPPWSVFGWTERWSGEFPRPFAFARLMVFAGFVAGVAIAVLGLRKPTKLPAFGMQAWAKFADLEAAGLFASQGAVLGKFAGELIAFDGPEHQILIGASRSGKGRGHVVPTLLSWGGSALVLDVKGELDRGDPRHGFPGTSGFRARLGRVLRFAPTDLNSHCFNPLLEVRRGANEVRDVQNIVDIIVDPKGEAKGAEAFWNASAKIVITGLILHVLYAEPAERKTLAVVREKLRDLDKTCEEMRATLHRRNARTHEPETHPEVLHAANSYLAGEERLRSGVKATAESFFGLFADPIVAEKTSRSDFRIGDLMCADKPVTLFLQPPPSDAQRLMPLMRLFINQVARSLMESQTHDALGRPKRHRLLLVLDEFPQLGRLAFFETMMGAMAGYGLKAYLVCQSLNHLIRAYGRDNVILDNCHLVTAFAAADPETAERIAAMAGEVWEVRPFVSEQRPRSLFGVRKGSISYREERRPLLLPADVRGLPRDEQMIFVSGCKPIRAKKLRFDHERIFAERLLPPAQREEGPTFTHDWSDVVALGKAAPTRKPLSVSGAERNARPKARDATAKPPGTAQADLFAATTPAAAAETQAPPASRAPKISELAMAGLRPPEDGTRVPNPAPEASGAEAELSPPEAPRRARATGV
jgi:type IV secretion system protein VirD4